MFSLMKTIVFYTLVRSKAISFSMSYIGSEIFFRKTLLDQCFDKDYFPDSAISWQGKEVGSDHSYFINYMYNEQ